jgi:Tol biopolymer transport system component
VTSTGAQANSHSYFPAISADGAWVAFMSLSSNLVVGDTNGLADTFLFEIATGQTTRVSVDSSGAQAGGSSGNSSALSADGRYIVFQSHASNLVAGDTNQLVDVFVHDRVSGQTARVSVSSSGAQGSGPSGIEGFTISGDGRFVVFVSRAVDLVPDDTNDVTDIFMHDRVTGQTSRVSVSSLGVQGNGYSFGPSVSNDGRYVAFESESSNLVPNDTNGVRDVFVRDTWTGTTARASEGPGGTEWSAAIAGATLSSNGLHLAFSAHFAAGVYQIFVMDLATHQVVLASQGPGLPPFNEGNSYSTGVSLSADGSIVAYRSGATNLIFGDTNGKDDIYLTNLFAETPTIAAYCTAGTSTHGCIPSISAAGLPRASAPAGFTITVSGVEGQKAGMIFYGISGAQAVPFGVTSSTMCVRPPHQRTDVQFSGGTVGMCDGTLVLDWNAFAGNHAEAIGWGTFPGRTVWAQAYYRDPLAPGGSNLSDALWFTVLE